MKPESLFLFQSLIQCYSVKRTHLEEETAKFMYWREFHSLFLWVLNASISYFLSLPTPTPGDHDQWKAPIIIEAFALLQNLSGNSCQQTPAVLWSLTVDSSHYSAASFSLSVLAWKYVVRISDLNTYFRVL